MCEYAFMRTTLDIPDNVMKKAKMMAVQEGVPLKAIVARALQKEVTQPVDPDRPEKVRLALEAIRSLPEGLKPVWDCPPETSFWDEDETGNSPTNL